jgi:transcriptional regulator of acetoin/glycerol metabolism
LSDAPWPSPSAASGPVPVEDDAENMPLVGRSAAMQEIYRVLARLMQTDLTVLISGESGTGKELVARRCTISGVAPMAVSWPSTWRRSRVT